MNLCAFGGTRRNTIEIRNIVQTLFRKIRIRLAHWKFFHFPSHSFSLFGSSSRILQPKSKYWNNVIATRAILNVCILLLSLRSNKMPFFHSSKSGQATVYSYFRSFFLSFGSFFWVCYWFAENNELDTDLPRHSDRGPKIRPDEMYFVLIVNARSRANKMKK